VIATPTTVLACGALLIRQLKAAIAGVAFGTSDVGYLHLSLGFCRSFPGDEPPNREKPVGSDSDCFGAIVPVTTSLRDPSSRISSSKDSPQGTNQNYFKRIMTRRIRTQRAHRNLDSNAAVVNRYLMAVLNARSHVLFSNIQQENKMKFALIGAAAIAAAAVVTPALAQDVASNPGYSAPFDQNANSQNLGPDAANWRNTMAAQALDNNNAYRYHGGPKYND
jgi:hypothetical protein